MFKRLTLTTFIVAILAMFSYPLFAQQPQRLPLFFTQNVEGWFIGGFPSMNGKNAACGAEFTNKDGSSITFWSDLIDGEFYMIVRNVEWNISDKPGTKGTLRINFYDDKGNITGGDADFIVTGTDSIGIPDINVKTFIPTFVSRVKMTLIMPGNLDNMGLVYSSATAKEVISALAQCRIKGENQAPPKPKGKEVDA